MQDKHIIQSMVEMLTFALPHRFIFSELVVNLQHSKLDGLLASKLAFLNLFYCGSPVVPPIRISGVHSSES